MEEGPLWGLRPPLGLGRITEGRRFHCRRRGDPAMASSILRALTLPGVDWNRTQAPLLVLFDPVTFGGPKPGQARQAAKAFVSCPAHCQVWTPQHRREPDVVVFNQHFHAGGARPNAIHVLWSSEQLGAFFEHPQADLRVSTSLLSNQTEVSFGYGCSYVRACRADPSRCPPGHAVSLRTPPRPLPPSGNQTQADPALVVSIIGNAVKPRSALLKSLSRRIAMANYGTFGNNRKRPPGSDRKDYATGSKLPMMAPYPFCYVPENKWEVPWGYVSEKAYDAFRSGCVPIWEGGLPPAYHQLYFPPRRGWAANATGGRVLLRPRMDYGRDWPSGEALAAEVEALAADEAGYAAFFDWDRGWFETGPLARSCREPSWCKLCAAAHLAWQGHCPPFL